MSNAITRAAALGSVGSGSQQGDPSLDRREDHRTAAHVTISPESSAVPHLVQRAYWGLNFTTPGHGQDGSCYLTWRQRQWQDTRLPEQRWSGGS